MLQRNTLVILVLALYMSGINAAPGIKVFKSEDAQGKAVFSDRATEDAQEIDVEDPMTFPAKVFTEGYDGFDYGGVKSNKKSAPEVHSYGDLLIIAPRPQETIRDNAGNLTIDVMVPNRILAGHKVQLVMNDKIISTYNGEPFHLQQVDRGTHTVRIEIVDQETGKVQKSSPTVSFTLQRHSILH